MIISRAPLYGTSAVRVLFRMANLYQLPTCEHNYDDSRTVLIYHLLWLYTRLLWLYTR